MCSVAWTSGPRSCGSRDRGSGCWRRRRTIPRSIDAMIVGVPREIKDQENRVGLLPSGVYQLVKRGHRVLVERGAGVGSGYPDADYQAAGAELLDDHAAVFRQAEMIVKVKEPLPSEYGLLGRGQILFTYLHLAANRELTLALLRSGVTALGRYLHQQAFAQAPRGHAHGIEVLHQLHRLR